MVETKKMKDKIVIFFKASNIKNLEVKKIVSEYKYFLGGFYTIPIKNGNETLEYKLVLISGKERTLAGKNFTSSVYLNKYSIDIDTIENFAITEIENSIKDKKIILIDEFGAFFLKSEKFLNLMLKLMTSEHPVLVWARDIKEIRKTFEKMDNILIFDLEIENENKVRKELENWLCEKIKQLR